MNKIIVFTVLVCIEYMLCFSVLFGVLIKGVAICYDYTVLMAEDEYGYGAFVE
jgi:hypothetical protein